MTHPTDEPTPPEPSSRDTEHEVSMAADRLVAWVLGAICGLVLLFLLLFPPLSARYVTEQEVIKAAQAEDRSSVKIISRHAVWLFDQDCAGMQDKAKFTVRATVSPGVRETYIVCVHQDGPPSFVPKDD